MNNLSGKPQANLTAGAATAESDTANLVARARVMMIISALTTVLAVAAVVVVIGYRVFGAHAVGSGAVTDNVLMLPKGAHVASTSVTVSYIAVTLEVDGVTEVRIFDRKTLQPVGRLHFGSELP
jgi:hypothetical protein